MPKKELSEQTDFLMVAKLRDLLYEAIVELSYVQETEDHSQCASAKGKQIVERGMELLGIKDLSAEHLPVAAPPVEPPTSEEAERIAYSQGAEAYMEWQNEHRAAVEAPVQATTGKYVVVADGEGAEACVIAGTDLHESLHTFMCCCGKPWRDCETKFIPDDIKLIDDPDEWTLDENGERFCLSWPHETGKIMLYKLSERKLGAVEAAPPLSTTPELTEEENAEIRAICEDHRHTWYGSVEQAFIAGKSRAMPPLSTMEVKSPPRASSELRDAALAQLHIAYEEDQQWRIDYVMSDGSRMSFNNRMPADMVKAQLRGIMSDFAAARIQS